MIGIEGKEDQKRIGMLGAFLKIALGIAFIFAVVFLSAGTLDYWQGWVYFLVNAAILVITLLVLAGKPGLIAERQKPGKGMKSWDKIYFVITTPLYFAVLVLAPLDAVRFHWSPEMPALVYAFSVAAYIFGQSLFLWAKKENEFFSLVVRIQKDRGQTVCSAGPYAIIRHPGYAGGILFGLVTPLMLGSLLLVIPSLISAIGIVVRTHLEDKMLKKELQGYEEYSKKVKHRLVPGIW
ncbi:MAG: isoprenylcysteine carboxylmethyltransferase family protein [Candidatus Diapherotrites archaeon]|nr:isoprenylcysteine carboxylmethyltransferase family protein [Candidatus Diapherotrites archaeon]